MKWSKPAFHPLCFVIASVVFVSGCAWTAQEHAGQTVSSQLLQEALAKQTTTNQELEGKLARLQLFLIEKDAQGKELNKKIEEAILEVVRTKAKLRSVESKAETASTLAEGEIALKALKTNGVGLAKDTDVLQAEELLKASALELKKENYGGSLYLATQAKILMKQSQERSKSLEKTTMMAGEVPFAMPLPLRVISPSKVREGPGLDFSVLFTLPKDAAIVGVSYKGLWVRVRTEDNRGGWVHYSLVGGRQEEP